MSYRFRSGNNLFSVFDHDMNVRVCLRDEDGLCADATTHIDEH